MMNLKTAKRECSSSALAASWWMTPMKTFRRSGRGRVRSTHEIKKELVLGGLSLAALAHEDVADEPTTVSPAPGRSKHHCRTTGGLMMCRQPRG